MRKLVFILFACSLAFTAQSQSFWFGPKGGFNVATQQGGSIGVQPMLGYNVGFFVESYDENNETGALYASLGLHQRGRSTNRFFSSFQNIFVPSVSYRYNNLSLEVGAKKFFKEKLFYKVGVRGEYTAFTNLEEANSRIISVNSPFPQFVRPVLAGMTLGGGYQFQIGDLYGISIEANIMPDFFNQYTSPEIPNVSHPITGQNVTVRAQEIRNSTLEVTVAFRFLRKVIYY
jgi:hypothetical protein